MKRILIGTIVLSMMASCSSETETVKSEDNVEVIETLSDEAVENAEILTEELEQGAEGMIGEVEELGNDVDSLLNEI